MALRCNLRAVETEPFDDATKIHGIYITLQINNFFVSVALVGRPVVSLSQS